MKTSFMFALLFGAVFVLPSCNKLAYKVLYGVEKPKPKSEADILEFLEKNKYPTERLYGLSEAAHRQKVGTGTSSVAKFTSAELYNREGFLVSAKDESIEDCWGKVYDFYKNIGDTSLLEVDRTRAIQADTVLMRGLVNLSGHAQAPFETGDYDYTVVVYWASFLGKLSKQNIDLAQLIKLYNPSLRVQIIQINMDYRSSWQQKK